jgi:hypothetical protein
MTTSRFDRQIALFGKEGQAKLRAAHVVIVGCGGVGSAVAPQVAMLGVRRITLIEPEEIETTNRNRHWCIRASDPIPGTLKVDIVERAIKEYDPEVEVVKIPRSLMSEEAFAAVKTADFVFGCVDSEGARLVLTELSAAYGKTYIDVASDIPREAPQMYGGEVCCAVGGHGCLVCLGMLDLAEAGRDLESDEQRRDRQRIYGVDRAALGRSGPSVVSINTVVAGLAVMEFVKLCTGMEGAARVVRYYGATARVSQSRDEPAPDCYYCKGIRGTGADADVERYVRSAASASA